MPSNRKTTINNRSVPYNTEAEMYVLGCVLIDNKCINNLNSKLKVLDFYDEKNKNIYQAFLNLCNVGRSIEVLEVIEELKRMNIANVETYNGYLAEMVDSVVSLAPVDSYVDIVLETAIERFLYESMNELSNEILDHKCEFNEILEKTENKIGYIVKRRRSSDFKSIGEAAEETYKKIEKIIHTDSNLTGLDTGFNNLNNVTLGLQKGDLIILAARPSVGKSSYAIDLAMNVAKLNKNAKVAFFSLEMSIEQIMMRVYAYETGVLLSKIRSGKLTDSELMSLGINTNELKNLGIFFEANPTSNIADIRAKCRQLKQKDGLDFIVIDYLQLISGDSNSRFGGRQEEVSKISRQLKMLAKELDVPILALSQLSRSVEERENKEPMLSDLRESGSIEQDADIVMFIYRRKDVEDQEIADELNEEVKKLNEQKKKTDEDSMLEVIVSIAKNRQGKLANIDYHFYGGRCKFAEQAQFRKVIKKKKSDFGSRF